VRMGVVVVRPGGMGGVPVAVRDLASFELRHSDIAGFGF
jgi:hypothetical protein